ncbi:DUF4340 domain-containing protein [Thiolinea disciformis]|uniref:DUF4340 domain-containing protein n=1 Tax=Thiolinea disciformis TaxID=125614 RepID=UPI0003706587|nr:DUF4340 domain-containing protein [Thiolinea disciformis]
MGLVSKRILVNVLLLALVIALAVGAWWWKGHKNAAQLTSLVAFSVGDVKELVIKRHQHDEQAELAFVRQEDQWMMTKPKVFPANKIRLRQVLTLIDEPVQAEYSADSDQLSAYGLLPPVLSLKINDQIIDLGKSNPVSGSRYVLHQGKVKLVNETVFSELQSDWLYFIAPQLIPSKSTLQQITFPDGSMANDAQMLAWQKAEATRLEQTQSAQATEALGSISAKLADGNLIEWRLGKLPNNDWAFDQVENGLRYRLPLDQVRSLLPKTLLPDAQ